MPRSRAGGRLDHVGHVALAGARIDEVHLLVASTRRGGRGRSRRGWRCPPARTSPSGTGTRCPTWRWSSATARPRRAARSWRWSGRMPRSVYQRIRSAIQRSCHSAAWSGGTKNSISICSNSRVRKMKLPGVISLRNALPTCAIPNGGFLRANCITFLKFTKMPWAVSGRRKTVGALVLDGAHVGLEHQVEVARLGEVAAALGAPDRRRVGPLGLGGLLQMVQPPALLAVAEALHQRIGEALQMARGLPGARVHQDRGVEGHHVVALLQVRAPPLGLHVGLQQHAVVAVVVGRGQATVDLGGLEDEAAPLAQRDDLVHGHGVGRHRRKP